MITYTWWKDVGERLLSTAVQAGLAVVVVEIARKGTLLDLDWLTLADTAGVAAVLALWKGWVARSVGDRNSASLVDTQ
jgi:hypothetical protein